MSMRPACTNCGLFMKPIKTGQVIEVITEDAAPYQVWSCDEYECAVCNSRVVVGWGSKPVAEHWQEGYARVQARAAYQIRS